MKTANQSNRKLQKIKIVSSIKFVPYLRTLFSETLPNVSLTCIYVYNVIYRRSTRHLQQIIPHFPLKNEISLNDYDMSMDDIKKPKNFPPFHLHNNDV